MTTFLLSSILIFTRLAGLTLALDTEQEAGEHARGGGEMQSTAEQEGYACERIFAFGLWGCEPRTYQLGLEGLLRDVRRRHMNCFLYGPRIGEGSAGIAQLKRDIELCRRYGMFVMPNSGSKAATLRRLAETFKDEPAVLGWYIRDEPDPEFLPEFQKCVSTLAEVAPRQPALCLFYRLDSVAEFAPHQPLLLTDCYPFTYMHDGTSIGPHFAIRSGPHAVSRGMGQFNMWDARGILEWMDMCRTLTGGLPHWITLQTFESGDGRQVRWREPTAAEMRLQTYLAVAGGAKGIQYFRYVTMTDAYGHPRPPVHGGDLPVLEEIGRLGAELTPLGPLLLDAEVAEPLAVIATLRPTPDPGTRVEVRRLRSTVHPVDYLVIFNNDILQRSSAQIHLNSAFLQGRRLYNLHTLEPVETEEHPGAITFSIALTPGGGKILSVASETDHLEEIHIILRGRCRNEASVLEIDYELAEKSGLDLGAASLLLEQYQEHLKAEKYAEALSAIRGCARAVQRSMRANPGFWSARRDLDYMKATLNRSVGGAPRAFHSRVSDAYRGLLGLFWEGRAASIAEATAQLRELVEDMEAAAYPLDEGVLETVEEMVEGHR